MFHIKTYLDEWDYTDVVERDGLRMNFAGRHRPLQTYFAALERAGLVVDRLVEVPDRTDSPGSRWRRVPIFLHIRAHHAKPVDEPGRRPADDPPK